ncbi:MAG: DUF3782 domain-containing protein [Spirochaetaceae bacterium]|nr:DUF3782 domain-containing protein [Spirochaetaceae bacterium]
MSELYNEPLTFEKVMAMFQETDKKFQETDRRMKETDERMKKTDIMIGKLGNRFGELIEHLVLPGIVEKFNTLGFNFSDASQPRRIFDPKTGQLLAEIDILLENGEFVIAVEVKSKLHSKDIDEHLARMDFLHCMAESKGDKRKYYGAIAGAMITKETRAYAVKAGFYVLEQSGDTMKLDIPEGFIPREW